MEFLVFLTKKLYQAYFYIAISKVDFNNEKKLFIIIQAILSKSVNSPTPPKSYLKIDIVIYFFFLLKRNH